jgi:DNA-binding XRE family transcriptional regulator
MLITGNEYAIRIKEARNSLDMTQKSFATPLNLKWDNIKDLETGRKNLTPELARKIEEIYSINLRWLITGQGSMFLLSEENANAEEELLKTLNADPLKLSSAKLLSELDDDKTRKVYEYLRDQKQLEDLQREKGA